MPASIVNNLVLLDTRVNGSAAMPFILDTGASTTVLDTRLVADLGLTATNPHAASTGGGSVDASEVTGVDVSVGGTKLGALTVAAIDLANLSAGLGLRIGGILGYDCFRRHVVEIDYGAPRVTFHDPDHYHAPADHRMLPLTLEDQVPFITAQIVRDGRTSAARLEFDTGMTGALTLLGQYVDEQRLLAPGQTQVAIVTGALLPGQVAARVTRMPLVQLGPFELRQVVTNLAPSAEAAGIEGKTVGVLGGDFLKRFTVVIDYSRHRVGLRASDARINTPMEFDMSGLSLTSSGDSYRAYRVRAVIPDSPGAEAGITAGDVLVSIDDRAVEELTLAEIRDLLRRPDRHYVLQLRRGDATHTATVRTRRLV